MDTLIKFVYGDKQYIFTPDHQISIRDNFRNVLPHTSRMPNFNGGFDAYGRSPAPSEIGDVQVSFWLHAVSPANMTTLLDDLGAMASWGAGWLYMQPVDQGADPRLCEARINNINYSSNVVDTPHRRQRVTINFQVARPFWVGQGTETLNWGEGSIWGDGMLWGGNAPWHDLIGTSTTFIVNVASGNNPTAPRINIQCQSGQSASNIIVERLVNGKIVDQLTYSGSLVANDQLAINCRAYTVRKTGSDAYANFDFLNSRWLMLEPGNNTIRVLMDDSGDEARIRLSYYHLWR